MCGKKRISDFLNKIIYSGGFWLFILSVLTIFSLYAPAKITVSDVVQNDNSQINKKNSNEKSISIIMYTGTDSYNIMKIIEVLELEKINITFEVSNAFVEKCPGLIDLVVANGHEIIYGQDADTDIKLNIDSNDWKNYSANNISDIVLNNQNLRNGSIVKMHATGKNSVEALRQIITGLKEKGYEIIPVSKMGY